MLPCESEQKRWSKDMDVITNDDAIELAYAFAIYKGMRVADLETRMDRQLIDI